MSLPFNSITQDLPRPQFLHWYNNTNIMGINKMREGLRAKGLYKPQGTIIMRHLNRDAESPASPKALSGRTPHSIAESCAAREREPDSCSWAGGRDGIGQLGAGRGLWQAGLPAASSAVARGDRRREEEAARTVVAESGQRSGGGHGGL